MSHSSCESRDRNARLDPLLRVSLGFFSKRFGIGWEGPVFLCMCLLGAQSFQGGTGTAGLATVGDTEESSELDAVILTPQTHHTVLTQHSCTSWLGEEVGGCW